MFRGEFRGNFTAEADGSYTKVAELGSQGQHRCLCFHTVPDRPITTRRTAGKDLQLLQLNFTRAAFTRIESKVPDDFSGFHHYDPCLEKFDLRLLHASFRTVAARSNLPNSMNSLRISALRRT